MGTIIGILGGMGPMATVNFFEKIIKNTSAKKDQEHHRMIIYNNPKIPSRVDAILEQGESPVQELIASAKLLEQAGASFIVIPCHTAHCWYQHLSNSVSIPIYSMIDVTTSHLVVADQDASNLILVLATTATVHAQLYQRSFACFGKEIVLPTVADQRIIMEAINQTKAGLIENNPHLKEIEGIMARYQSKGVTVVVAGCTDLSLLFPHLHSKCDLVDPMDILARFILSLIDS